MLQKRFCQFYSAQACKFRRPEDARRDRAEAGEQIQTEIAKNWGDIVTRSEKFPLPIPSWDDRQKSSTSPPTTEPAVRIALWQAQMDNPETKIIIQRLTEVSGSEKVHPSIKRKTLVRLANITSGAGLTMKHLGLMRRLKKLAPIPDI